MANQVNLSKPNSIKIAILTSNIWLLTPPRHKLQVQFSQLLKFFSGEITVQWKWKTKIESEKFNIFIAEVSWNLLILLSSCNKMQLFVNRGFTLNRLAVESLEVHERYEITMNDANVFKFLKRLKLRLHPLVNFSVLLYASPLSV